MPETGARPYLACLEERRTRELFESAVRSFTGNPTNAAITFCTSFQEFTERLIIQPWPQLAVFTCNSSTIREALSLRGRYPEIALVPWAQAGIENRVLVDLVNGGFPHIILAGGNDSPGEVEEVICTALVKPLHSGLLQKLEIALTPRMTEFLSHLLRATRRPFTPADAACLYASDASTLRRHLAHHGLPPIGRLIGWFRLFHAALLLESRRTSVEVAANSLEFPSRTALLNQIRRYCRDKQQRVPTTGRPRSSGVVRYTRVPTGLLRSEDALLCDISVRWCDHVDTIKPVSWCHGHELLWPMNVLLDAKLPRHWVGRIEACAQMAAVSGMRFGVIRADPEIDLVEQGLRHWPAVVVQALSARAGNGVPGPGGAKSSGVPIVGYVRQAEVALVARALHGGWALKGVLIEDVSDKPWDVLEALQSALRFALPAQLEQDLVQIAGERIGRLSMQALLDGRRITVALLSELYGKSQRTLRRDFARKGLPRPERWAAWLTTLAASAYLCASRRTIDSVGFALGYESGAAVSQACRRLTGSGLSAFRGPRGYEALFRHLRAECVDRRARKALPSGE